MSDLIQRAQAAQSGVRSKPREKGEEFVFAVRDEVAELLEGSPFHVDSYLQNAYQQILKSNLLRAAAAQSPDTVYGAVILGATLHLQIGGPLGHFYLTPRNEGRGDRRKAVCVPMIGYRGFFELGYRSGLITKYDYLVVREGDRFERGSSSERGGNWYEHESADPDDEDRPLTHVVALAHKTNGTVDWRAMSRGTIEKRRPTSIENTPWLGKHAEQMYIKTPFRELAKYQQLSIDSARAVSADEMISAWNRTTGAIETVDPDGDVLMSDQPATGAPAADPAPADQSGTPNPAEAPPEPRDRYETQEEYEAAVARGEVE